MQARRRVALARASLAVSFVVLLLLGGVVVDSAPAMSLMTQDTNVFFGPSNTLQRQAYSQSRYMGAQFVRGLVARDAATNDPNNLATWQAVDSFVDTTRAHGLEPYLTLTYRPADWGDPATAMAIPSVAEFSYFCRVAASRYGGRVSNYSIWNEPNGLKIKDPAGGSPTAIPAATYGQLYRGCYGEIHRQDPSAHVYFGELATGANSCDYVTNALSASNVTYADGLAIHPYQFDLAPDQAYAGAPCRGIGHLADWNATAAAGWTSGKLKTPSGGTVPLMVTEFGYCTTDGECDSAGTRNGISEDMRADWIGRAWRAAAAAGVTVFGYYHLVKQPNSDTLVKWDSGIVNLDGTGTPSVLALWKATGGRGRNRSFNGDALADLVMRDPATGGYAVALSSGGGFGTPTTWLASWGTSSQWTATGDFDGDGLTDLIRADPATNTYSVALSDGSRFAAPATWLSGWSGSPAWARVGDFNGDGRADLIVAGPGPAQFAVALSDGTKLNAPGSGVWLNGWGSPPAWADVGDFNGDGKSDLIEAGPSPAQYAVALADAAGTALNAPGSGVWLNGWGSPPAWADVGDFNGDGKSDLIEAGPSPAQYAVAVSDARTLGSGGVWLNGWGSPPTWATAADVNGDGKSDLIEAGPAAGQYAVATANAAGTALGGPYTGVWLSGVTGTPTWAGTG